MLLLLLLLAKGRIGRCRATSLAERVAEGVRAGASIGCWLTVAAVDRLLGSGAFGSIVRRDGRGDRGVAPAFL